MEKIVYEFSKGDGQMIKARLSDFKGQLRADVRVYFQAEDGDWRPTKKGINLTIEQLTEMKEAIERLQEEAKGVEKK